MSINAEVALNDGHNPVELQVAIKKLRKATADVERLVRDRKRRGAMSRSQKRRLKPARSADSLVLVLHREYDRRLDGIVPEAKEVSTTAA